MIRKINENDRDAFMAMTEDFYNSDAVYYRIPKEYRERTFEELMRSDVYTEGFIFEKDGKTAGYALISKSFSQEAGGIVVWLEELFAEQGPADDQAEVVSSVLAVRHVEVNRFCYGRIQELRRDGHWHLRKEHA